MLYISLVLSATLLSITCVLARYSKRPLRYVIGMGISFSLCLPFLIPVFFPAVFFQSVLLVVVVGIWRFIHGGSGLLLTLAGGATVIAYVLPTFNAWEDQLELVRLRERFPFESMASRVPEAKLPLLTEELSSQSLVRLGRLENKVEWEIESWRVIQLDLLHRKTVTRFVNSQGFGVRRVMRSKEYWISRGLRDEPPVRQRGDPVRYPWSYSVVPPEAEIDGREDLQEMHDNGMIDFVHPNGFGLVESRTRVAGFQEHQFSKMPEPIERWQLKRLDLMGLLMHEEPVAYISENLPRMDELRDAPTRPLDAFEAAGLEQLRQGEDFFIRGDHATLRMLGSLRSLKQCVDCHGGQRGDLLGAFSYILEQEPEADTPKLTAQNRSE